MGLVLFLCLANGFQFHLVKPMEFLSPIATGLIQTSFFSKCKSFFFYFFFILISQILTIGVINTMDFSMVPI